MDSAEVSVFKEADEISLAGLLEGQDSMGLETKVRFASLSNLPDETLEGEPEKKYVLSEITFR